MKILWKMNNDKLIIFYKQINYFKILSKKLNN